MFLLDDDLHFEQMKAVILENQTFNDIDYPSNLYSWAGGKLYNSLIVDEAKHSVNLETLEKFPITVDKIFEQFYFI